MDPQFFVGVFLTLIALGGFFWLRSLRGSAPVVPDRPATRTTPPDPHPPIFLSVASALEDALFIVAPDRRISFANHAAGGLLGIEAGQIVGQTLMAVLRDLQADEAVERAFASDEKQSATLVMPLTGRILRLVCQPMSGAEEGVVLLLRDVTQMANLERARRELIANVSHELRTPLATVRLLVDTLAGGPPPEIGRRMIGQVEDELGAMTTLIDELQELSQIESGRLVLRLEPASVAEITARAGERLVQQIERRGLTLQVDIPPELPAVIVDRDRIGQVLINLLHNALKWTPAGGVLAISADVADHADSRVARELAQVEGSGWLVLRVRDTGIGIPAGEVERVFERFYKVDRARTRDSGGSGLGLAIAKHIVERHGGRIWAESREGHGSTFSMLLPTA
ncbi:MAG TPA: ATP-binding protein [Herpetosiphonaceae bacterium]|nr:ATP-binding protein [Herpetosiphonaceae bacterium]